MHLRPYMIFFVFFVLMWHARTERVRRRCCMLGDHKVSVAMIMVGYLAVYGLCLVLAYFLTASLNRGGGERRSKERKEGRGRKRGS